MRRGIQNAKRDSESRRAAPDQDRWNRPVLRLVAAGSAALLVILCAGCYTLLRHPSVNQGFASYEPVPYENCRACHTGTLVHEDAWHSWWMYFDPELDLEDPADRYFVYERLPWWWNTGGTGFRGGYAASPGESANVPEDGLPIFARPRFRPEPSGPSGEGSVPPDSNRVGDPKPHPPGDQPFGPVTPPEKPDPKRDLEENPVTEGASEEPQKPAPDKKQKDEAQSGGDSAPKKNAPKKAPRTESEPEKKGKPAKAEPDAEKKSDPPKSKPETKKDKPAPKKAGDGASRSESDEQPKRSAHPRSRP